MVNDKAAPFQGPLLFPHLSDTCGVSARPINDYAGVRQVKRKRLSFDTCQAPG